MTEDIIKELEVLPESMEAMQKSPIIKPLLEFREAVKSLLRDNSAEREYLESKDKRLKELLETGVYDNSFIAQRYADVLEVYKRLFLIFTKYTEVADDTVKKMKKIVDNYYIPRSEYNALLVQEYEKPKPQKVEIDKFFPEEPEPEQTEKPKRYVDPPKKTWMQHLKEVRIANPGIPQKIIFKMAKETYK